MQFKYVALNQENKKLSGVINAASETLARAELNNLGFAILSITEIAETPTSTTTQTKLKFEALDKSGKKVIGTIPSADQNSAYKRLTEEYNFEVLAIYPPEAPESAIRIARESGIQTIKKTYEEQSIQKKEEDAAEKKMAYEGQRQLLLKKIDHILEKTKNFIKTFELELKPEPRSHIKKYANKLARVKTSKSMDYIRQTAEELLKLLQEQEMFLHEDRLITEKNRLKITTHNLLNEIRTFGHERKSAKEALIDRLQDWQTKNLSDTKKPNLKVKTLKPIVKRILNFLLDKEEVHQLKMQIKKTEEQMFAYVRIWFTTVGAYKEDATRNLKALWQERKRLKKELKKIKAKSHPKTSTETTAKPPLSRRILGEFNTFTGWLLAFYLIYYFLSNYFLIKDLGFTPPWNYQLFNSHLFKYVLTILFIFHGATSFNLTFSRHNVAMSIILYPISVFGALLIIYNL